MRKQIIRLNENKLKQIIKESVKRILNEYTENTYDDDFEDEYDDKEDLTHGHAQLLTLERAGTSLNGNPRFFIRLSNGLRGYTDKDASFAYALSKRWVGKPVKYAIAYRNNKTVFVMIDKYDAESHDIFKDRFNESKLVNRLVKRLLKEANDFTSPMNNIKLNTGDYLAILAGERRGPNGIYGLKPKDVFRGNDWNEIRSIIKDYTADNANGKKIPDAVLDEIIENPSNSSELINRYSLNSSYIESELSSILDAIFDRYNEEEKERVPDYERLNKVSNTARVLLSSLINGDNHNYVYINHKAKTAERRNDSMEGETKLIKLLQEVLNSSYTINDMINKLGKWVGDSKWSNPPYWEKALFILRHLKDIKYEGLGLKES